MLFNSPRLGITLHEIGFNFTFVLLFFVGFIFEFCCCCCCFCFFSCFFSLVFLCIFIVCLLFLFLLFFFSGGGGGGGGGWFVACFGLLLLFFLIKIENFESNEKQENGIFMLMVSTVGLQKGQGMIIIKKSVLFVYLSRSRSS